MSYTVTHLLCPLVILCVACTCGAQFTVVPRLQEGEAVDMAVDSDGRVFLAAGRRLIRLDGDLTLTENVTVNSTILQIALSTDATRLVACFSDESCAVYDAGNFSAGQLVRVQQASASVNLALFTSPSDTFYVGSEGSLPGTSDLIYLTQSGFGDAKFTRSSGTDFTIAWEGFWGRDFADGFAHGMYAYYLAVDTTYYGVTIQSVRVCHVDSCESQCNFATLYEAELPCGTLSVGQTICGVSLVENFLNSPGTTVVYSVCGPRNHICSVPLASIDAEINATYSACSTGGTGTYTAPTLWQPFCSVPPHCNSLGPFVSECEHDPPLALVSHIYATSVLYNLDSDISVDELTATLPITVDGITLLYVGYSQDEMNHFLVGLHVQGTTTRGSFSGAFYTDQVSSPVRELHWYGGLDYVYAASEDEVFQIPLEQCSLLTDCQSCTASPNPLCGWCRVEQRCSRPSQCQNSTEPLRWVQDGAECISSVLTQDQFVLGIGHNVSVNVTPSLPPLLPGDSYSCQFKQTGGSLEFTTTATTGDGMLYTCNLKGMVPAFDGVSLAFDFSLVSSMARIPFGTEEALTIYNCSAAMSCTECVETDNVCGWYNCGELGSQCVGCMTNSTAFDCVWCGDSTCEVESECSGSLITSVDSCPEGDGAVATLASAAMPLLVLVLAILPLGLSC